MIRRWPFPFLCGNVHDAKQIAAAKTTMVPFVAAGIFYYIFNFVVAWVMELLEKKFSYYH